VSNLQVACSPKALNPSHNGNRHHVGMVGQSTKLLPYPGLMNSHPQLHASAESNQLAAPHANGVMLITLQNGDKICLQINQGDCEATLQTVFDTVPVSGSMPNYDIVHRSSSRVAA
jgi:hypothetical protein